MADNKRDIPGVIVFPPLIPLTVLVVGILLDVLVPLALLNGIAPALRAVIGLVLVALGLASILSGDRASKRVGTNVNPMQPSLALTGQGIFAHLRNPMYVGMALVVLGIVVGFALEWTFVAAVVGALVMHFGVVVREERYLEAKFGEDYRRYKVSVPRYGWKF